MNSTMIPYGEVAAALSTLLTKDGYRDITVETTDGDVNVNAARVQGETDSKGLDQEDNILRAHDFPRVDTHLGVMRTELIVNAVAQDTTTVIMTRSDRTAMCTVTTSNTSNKGIILQDLIEMRST